MLPLLIIGDSPTANTGLGRICRDLSTRISANLADVFRLATFGYGGAGTRSLPFQQYSWTAREDWLMPELPEVWKDFAGDEKGIVLTIWDASRLLWFSRPEMCPDLRLREFLTHAPFECWGYWPIDASGVDGKLTAILGHVVSGYDRNLAASKWAEDILHRTLPEGEFSNLPHGIETSVFRPRPRVQARHGFGQRIGAKRDNGKWFAIPDDALLIGIVATNQARKDFGLGIASVAELKKSKRVVLWIHTDKLERYWSLPALLNDYGFDGNEALISFPPMSDETLSWCYSACDVTLGIGCGEGFGYPIFESLACGTPCIHGSLSGAAEHLAPDCVIAPDLERIEGVYSFVRGVYDSKKWAEQIQWIARRSYYALPEHLDWKNLWPKWEEWLRHGLDTCSPDAGLQHNARAV